MVPAGRTGVADSHDVAVPTAGVELPGSLELPRDARGLVIFAHGSGSSRHSPRNRYVASVLHEAGLGTLLFDLLTAQEAADRENVFDIDLLADRLLGALRWAMADARTHALQVGPAARGAPVRGSAPHCPRARIRSGRRFGLQPSPLPPARRCRAPHRCCAGPGRAGR